MAASKHGRVHFSLHIHSAIVDRVWERVKDYEPVAWDGDADTLSELINAEDIAHLKSFKEGDWTVNFALREAFAKQLKATPSLAKREALFDAIIMGWGGIQSGDRAIYQVWSNKVAGFEPENVWRFADEHMNHRISSWSKVLSFADHHIFPVYDSRNAIALNIMLEEWGRRERFFMPGPQSPDLIAVKKFIHKRWRGQVTRKRLVWAGYGDYAKLLKAIADKNGYDSILHAEMRLFSASIPIALQYKDANSIEVPKKKPKKVKGKKGGETADVETTTAV